MKHLILFIAVFVCGIRLGMAQEENHDDKDQVIVFRNTGETNLFYAHELDSISLSCYDADSVVHDELASQVFYAKDTTLIVPLCEIDSVAFGTRNVVEYYEDVRIITPDSCWVIRYDGNCVYYKPDTPDSVLPKVGNKLFYADADKIFPVGLQAKVVHVENCVEGYAVQVSPLEITDIFKRLFYAGEAHSGKMPSSIKRAPILFKGSLSNEFDWGTSEEKLKFGLSLNYDFNGRIVANPFANYYYVNGVFTHSISTPLTVSMKKAEFSKELDLLTVPLGRYAVVFTPKLKLGVLAELNGDLSGEIELKRASSLHIEYEKRKGENPKIKSSPVPEASQNRQEVKTSFLLNGNCYLAANATFDFSVVNEFFGARLKCSMGPSVSGAFGIECVRQLAEYDAEVYAKANIDISLKAKVEATTYKHNLIWGEENTYKLFSLTHEMLPHSYDLLPIFIGTRAVKHISAKQTQVSVATKTSNETILKNRPQTGFEIVDKQNQVVDSVTVDPVKPNEEIAGYTTKFNVALDKVEDVVKARPFVRYAGYIIRGESKDVASDLQMQPFVSMVTNGAASCISGYPFTGEIRKDSTLFVVGNYLPVMVRDSVFDNSHPIPVGSYIDKGAQEFIVGIWKGNQDGMDVEYTFNDDETGASVIQGRKESFTYKVNDPRSACVTLYFDNDTKTLIVLSLNGATMKYCLMGDDSKYTLIKQSNE